MSNMVKVILHVKFFSENKNGIVFFFSEHQVRVVCLIFRKAHKLYRNPPTLTIDRLEKSYSILRN